MSNAFEDNFSFVVRAQTGSRFSHRTSDFHAYPFSVYGYYDWRNWAVAIALCSSGDHIIEIGANIGTETLGFADIVGETGRVSAFEPFPDNVKSIRENVALNQMKQVSVYSQAVGAINETLEFVVPSSVHMSGIGYVARGDVGNGMPKMPVECVTLDSLRRDLGPSRAIFIDVEGAELGVLRGAQEYLKEFMPTIVLEAASSHLRRSGYDLDSLLEVINVLGYQAFRIGRFGLTEIDLNTTRNGNWLCVPSNRPHEAKSVTRMIRRCGFAPCFAGLNPLTWKRV